MGSNPNVKPAWYKRLHRAFGAALELAVICPLGAVVPRLSRRAELRLARAFGAAAFLLFRRTRRVAMANLGIVYGDAKTAAQKRGIAKRSFEHSVLVFLDYFWFSRDTEARLARYCSCADAEAERWISGKFPGFFCTAHIGNWEVGGQYIAGRGREIWSVYKPIGSGKTLTKLLRFRGVTGQRVIPKQGATTGILRAIKNGGLVALLLDQHTDLREGGVYLDFFGLPATFSNLAGVISNRAKIPVCVACGKYDPAADRYLIKTYGTLTAEETAALAPEEITKRIAALIGEMILDNPEQWLWGYRRWKRCPANADLSRFPFYAMREW